VWVVGLPRSPPWPWRGLRWPSRVTSPFALCGRNDHEYRPRGLRRSWRTRCRFASSCLGVGLRPRTVRSAGSAPLLWREHLSLVFKDRPSTDSTAARPLPAGRPRRGQSPFGSELPPSEHVPSLPFLPASTVYAASTACGFVAPRSRSWGSPRFQPRGLPPASRVPCLDAFPDGAIPFGAFPSIAAVPRHRGRYPLAVPPRFDSQVPRVSAQGRLSLQGCRPQGVAPQPSPLRGSGVSTRSPPDAPLGLESPRSLGGPSLQPSEERCWPTGIRAAPEGDGRSTGHAGRTTAVATVHSRGSKPPRYPAVLACFWPEGRRPTRAPSRCSWSVELASVVTPGPSLGWTKPASVGPFARSRRWTSRRPESHSDRFAASAERRSAGRGDDS
jgi:hypothetical protein